MAYALINHERGGYPASVPGPAILRSAGVTPPAEARQDGLAPRVRKPISALLRPG
ncbi:hypothetical protein [Actinoplanes sp. NPDC020271]|uniref:hypothetical protein n=1 Tax=Actinoplanes sp. NPDC020271 TaxID=3363896 RepID=UPI0037926E1D